MSGFDLSTPAARRRVYARALWADDGWVREFGLNNFHRISERAFRSGQPSPRHLSLRIPRHGIRTVINLRGEEPDNPMLALEADACERLGVRLEHLRTYSRDLPTREVIHQAHELLQRIEYPVWFHCKSGADRAGLMATLYLHWIEGVPLEQTRQLKLWPYFHYRYAKTGLLDYFFETYLKDTAERPMSLLEWVDTRYDPKRLKRAFKPVPVMDALVDRLLRRE
ncbi:fused DSP-PTPase phosphatase/NAD kinase-like protein [Thioalkalivibrio sulfidiphilus]|uniref:Protein tyrosine/serine phosphatase n=1 Tax=Thioalkalivibrio sulfidiphilus (strain HL-EbGR7) TaxID=396588 RepID=B8GQU7_THISH|nr:sulfur transferase domain-containing protein [Thioalkalivibrio sulfidiphilus]ACL74321.1 protein tyrosine/serine phosphatase [Thioalkalivibrio sulfidiphilus HL-EbGr7]